MPRRSLAPHEIEEARLVFGSALDYTRVYVFEGATWTDLVDKVGAKIQKRVRGPEVHNAITLGATSYFPIPIRTSTEYLAKGDLSHMTWLIHELTHQWQYQIMGWRYLTDALHIQLREGQRGYDYKRAFPSHGDALKEAKKLGQKFINFNPEQQGDIARDYYLNFKQQRDCTPWDPFIEEIQKARRLNARKP